MTDRYDTKLARNLRTGDMVVLRDGPAYVRFITHGPSFLEDGRVLDRNQIGVQLNDSVVVLPPDRIVQFYRPPGRYDR